MTKEENDLLLKDLCARLPYGVICKRYENAYQLVDIDIKRGLVCLLRDEQYVPYSIIFGDEIKQYIRPLSSITEEEKKELRQISEEYLDDWSTADSSLLKWKLDAKTSSIRATFYNSHHLDWNGLIEKNLALEAPENMYI